MRLLYLDEAGSDRKATTLLVAGVLVHGDVEWPEIDRRIAALVEKYIPAADRLGFVFHATDIFHGADYFDRRKPEWPMDRRMALLADLANIINELHLPVVSGGYRKDGFGTDIIDPLVDRPGYKSDLIHNVAAMDCLIWADRWLERFAPSELATVVHEDGTSAKRLIKNSVRLIRSGELLDRWGLSRDERVELGLPLRRVIDTVHFADKADARPLQLADLCAFILGRVAKDHAVPEYVFEVIWQHLRWMSPLHSKTESVTGALSRGISAQEAG